METILIIDDEHRFVELVREILLDEDEYRVLVAMNDDDALEALSVNHVDLILLDLGLRHSRMQGLDLLQLLRQRSSLPIIVVSGDVTNTTCKRALDIGADDYVNKPIHPAELVARIRAVQRRVYKQRQLPIQLSFRDVTIDKSRYTVEAAGRSVSLSPIEFEILWQLAQNAGNVVTYQDLIENVWARRFADVADGDRSIDENVLRVHVYRLRSKLQLKQVNVDNYIVTIPNRGYMIEVS